jgi:purine-nucleoside phosphorylase
MLERINESVDYIKSRISSSPATGIILGTGLGGLAEEIEVAIRIPYSDIPNFPVSTVEGHSGNLIFGQLGDQFVVAMQGRFHYYEGYDMKQATFPIRVLKYLGIKRLFISNAAGGINPEFQIGDLMLITDHINLFPENPLRGTNHPQIGPRFPDMSEAYDRSFQELAKQEAKALGFLLQEGIYVGNPGPSFETPAEYTFYRIVGGSAVGMSTVPEVIVARHMDLPVLAISVITNLAVPGNFQKNSHIDVQEAAKLAEKNLARLFISMTSYLK